MKNKNVVWFTSVLVVWVFGVLISLWLITANNYEPANAEVWLNYFLSKDYESADTLVYDNTNKILPSTLGKYIDNEDNYIYVMDKLVDCIISVQIVESSDGYLTVGVEYVPYILLEEIDVDVSDIIESYLNAELDKSEIEGLLTNRYTRILQEQLFVTSELEGYIEVQLVEDGKYIYGVRTFISDLLSATNISDNLSLYEDTVVSKVDDEIENY